MRYVNPSEFLRIWRDKLHYIDLRIATPRDGNDASLVKLAGNRGTFFAWPHGPKTDAPQWGEKDAGGGKSVAFFHRVLPDKAHCAMLWCNHETRKNAA